MTSRLFIVFIAIVTLMLTFYGVVSAEVDGFRGIKWGTELSKLSNEMSYIKTDPEGIKIYSKKDDKLIIGKAVVVSIEYHFWDDKFCGVLIRSKGNSNFYFLKEAAVEQFGEGRRLLPKLENYIWVGKVTYVTLENLEALVPGAFNSLSIYSKKFLDEGERQHREKVDGARGGLFEVP